jgi:glc operon protein GlcG
MCPRRVLQLLLIAAPFMFCPVLAQTSLQPPPIIPYGLPITIENAKLAAAAAVTEAHSHGWAMAIAIVDPAGLLVYFEKMTDAQNASVELSLEKARTSALFRRPTRVFQDALGGFRAMDPPGFL